MSYRENLGRVKGDKGKVYIPDIVTRDNKKYITWTLQEESNSVPQDMDITPKVYLPSVDSNGNISFVLTESTLDSIGAVNIKGPQGPAGAVDTNVVTNLPAKSNAQEGIIYIHDDGIATVFDTDTNDFYDLDNLVKFQNYWTKTEIQDKYYSKTDVDNLLGNIMQCQESLIYLLDKDSIINIPSDD